MKYFKSYWNERTGDPLSNDWGTSWWYFETNDELVVIRQLTLFGNGKVLKYDNDHLEDKFGGLAEQPLEETGEMLAIEGSEFEKIWKESLS